RAAHEAGCFGKESSQRNPFALGDAGPAEAEELPHEIGAAFPGDACVIQVGRDWAARWEFLASEEEVPEDGGEQVIKVVCDAAREHAHAFELLRLEQRRFRP